MNKVKVGKAELLEKLRANREKHRELFERAQDGFRKAAIKRLDKALADARRGKPIMHYLGLQPPVDHTRDYLDAEAMLALSVDEHVEVSRQEFECYVLDRWSWSASTLMLNSSYASGRVVEG